MSDDRVELAEEFHDALTRQLLVDADEMEACGAGNEAANMRRLVARCLEMRAYMAERDPSIESLQAEVGRLREALIDWRNCWLCPETNFDAEVERLLRGTESALAAKEQTCDR